MVKLKGRSGRGAPLSDYQLEEGWWQTGGRDGTRPFVGGATYRPSAFPVVIKQWPRKTGVDDGSLREIWRDEIRQLNRLKGLPKASTYLAALRDSFEDPQAFSLVLDCGNRVPLAYRTQRLKPGYWEYTPRTISSRLRLWQEVRRLSTAIGILHGQGFLHRNIDPWAVMTAGGNEPDFLLTGFEWSMRLSSNIPSRRSTAYPVYSFYEDWRALGNLISWILKIPSVEKASEFYRADPSANTDFLYGPERNLLRLLISADPLTRLDSDVVGEQLDYILPTLEQQQVGSEAKLVLALRLDSQHPLSRAIRDASDRTIELTDYDAQRRFVADALAESPSLVSIKNRLGVHAGYRLTSARMTIELVPYQMKRGGDTSWSLAEGRSILSDKPAQAEMLAERALDGWELEIVDLAEVGRRVQFILGKTTRWDSLINTPPLDPATAALMNRSYSAAMLVQVVDMLWRAAQIWPVKRISIETRGAVNVLTLEGREDAALSALSDALKLEPPAARLLKAIRDETIQIDGEWQFEPPWVCRRLQLLRKWSHHEQDNEQIFA